MTKKLATEVHTTLVTSGFAKVGLYHGGLTPKRRKEIHQMFMNDDLDCIIATEAYGLGIDKADIRNVIHYGAPKNIPAYYQEIGRAGRDGLQSKIFTFWTDSDFQTLAYFLHGRDKITSYQRVGIHKQRPVTLHNPI